MGGRHKYPKPADSKCRANLISVQSKPLFGLAEEDLNRPAHQIRIQDGLGSDIRVCTDKGAQGTGYAESLFRKRNEDNRIFQVFQISLIAIHTILPFANGNEADIGISFTDEGGELGNLLLDTSREDEPVCFERTKPILSI